MDEYQNDLRQNKVESSSITMQELSHSIQEIISTPDISFYLNSPTDCGDLNMVIETLKIDESQNAKKSLTDIKVKVDVCENELVSIKEEIKGDIQKVETKNTLKSKLLPLAPMMKKHTNYSDLIRAYCLKCKKTSAIFNYRKCQKCETMLSYMCIKCTCVNERLIRILTHIKYECDRESIFKCTECNYKSFRKMLLIKHMKTEHPVQNYKGPVQNWYQCSICYKKFKTQFKMLVHLRICGKEFILQCQYCPFKTKFKNGLAIHAQMKHQDLITENYHKCPNCGKKYMTLTNLKRHIRRVCGQKSKFECEHCDYKINREYSFLKHMKENHSNVFLVNKFLSMHIQ